MGDLTNQHQSKTVASFFDREDGLNDSKGRLRVCASAATQEELNDIEDANGGLTLDIVSYGQCQ